MPRPTALSLAALGAAMSVSLGVAGPASATTTLAAPAGTYDALMAGAAHPTADGTGCVLPVEWSHVSPDQVDSYYLQVGLAEPKAPSGTKDPGIPVTARATSSPSRAPRPTSACGSSPRARTGPTRAGASGARRGAGRSADARSASRQDAECDTNLEAGAELPRTVLPGLAAARPLGEAGLRRLRRLPRGLARRCDRGCDGRRHGRRRRSASRSASRSAWQGSRGSRCRPVQAALALSHTDTSVVSVTPGGRTLEQPPALAYGCEPVHTKVTFW